MSGTRTDPPVVTAGPDKITADQSEAITRNDTPETLTEAEAKVTVQRINAAVQNLTFLVNKLPPRRIQFTRADRLKGRTMADVAGTDAVRWVGRPSKYGNPHPVESVTHMCGICGVGHDQADAVAEYARYLLADAERIVRARVELAGLTLACACPVGTPCHADLLVNIVDARSDAAAAVVVIVAARPAIGGDDV